MTTNDGAITWREVAFLPDCAHAALGDPRLLDDASWRQRPLPYLQLHETGFGMLYGLAETDGLPIDLGEVNGRIVAARLEFTNDVAALELTGEGRWSPIGRLLIGSEGAVALDKRQQHLPDYRHEIPLPAGWYAAEAFTTQDDHLGLRLVAADLTPDGL